jgi:SAM-dependent methyltransferase
VSSFTADWLTLREPYDARARNPTVRAAVVKSVARLPSLSIVDLACGTGSTLRALADHLPAQQNWKLVDNDLGLLSRATDTSHPRAKVRTAAVDLARDLELALDGAIDLLTTSALLDLVSERWLQRFAIEVAARKLRVYAALTYDGRVTFEPSDTGDGAIMAAVEVHQRRDQGFGAALGPNAARRAITRLEGVGYSLVYGFADWVIEAPHKDMQVACLESWAGAAREVGQSSAMEISSWLARRREAVASGQSSIRIGHVDIFANPVVLR